MILETLTMPGWRLSLSTSMMTQVSIIWKIVSSSFLKTCFTVVLNTLSLWGQRNSRFCRTMTCLCCYCRQQCQRAATASWRWRRTSPVGWCWLVVPALRESFQFPGAGCQRKKSPLVTKDERLYFWCYHEGNIESHVALRVRVHAGRMSPNLNWIFSH